MLIGAGLAAASEEPTNCVLPESRQQRAGSQFVLAAASTAVAGATAAAAKRHPRKPRATHAPQRIVSVDDAHCVSSVG
jgi:hypothetical protein